MENALSLKEIAELTYGKVRDKGSFTDWCRYLLEHKENLWIICNGRDLLGMLIAKIAEPSKLYAMELVTLRPGCFVEFTNRVSEFFGEIKTVEFLRRGVLKQYSWERFRKLANL